MQIGPSRRRVDFLLVGTGLVSQTQTEPASARTSVAQDRASRLRARLSHVLLDIAGAVGVLIHRPEPAVLSQSPFTIDASDACAPA
jgi:hypothetical protein